MLALDKPENFQNIILCAFFISTPLGNIIAISDDKALVFLEFAKNNNLESEITRFKNKKLNIIFNIIIEENNIIKFIKQELEAYFAGNIISFKTPFYLLGSNFQKKVWYELLKTPYGVTRSYACQARAVLGKSSACRAVANANSVNKLVIIVPCHRIIRLSGDLGGYAAGIDRKKWLIDHESKILNKI